MCFTIYSLIIASAKYEVEFKVLRSPPASQCHANQNCSNKASAVVSDLGVLHTIVIRLRYYIALCKLSTQPLAEAVVR